MSFRDISKLWECSDCKIGFNQKVYPEKCPNPDCPSNKKEKTLVELIRQYVKPAVMSIEDSNALYIKLCQLASDAGEGGKIVGLTQEEIMLVCAEMEDLRNRQLHPNTIRIAKSILKKLEAE